MTAPIYTIGHSNHPADRFQDLLGLHDVEVLVDVRSQPTSRYAPHFNQDVLRLAVVERGRKYIFLGRAGRTPQGSAILR